MRLSGARPGNSWAMSPKAWLLRHAPWLRILKRSIFNREEEARIGAALDAVAAFPSVRRPRKRSAIPGQLIVSMTSYPPRFETVAATVKSLLDQTIEARLILWIAECDMERLPRELLNLTEFGLEIRPCSNLGVYKKIVPALKAFPDAYIVTADDDLFYPPTWLEQICTSWRPDQLEIIGARGHVAKFRPDGRAMPYTDWEMETPKTEVNNQRERLFLTGGAGVLYPPGSLHREVTNENLFMKLCPDADDVWLFCMAEMQGTPRRRITGQIPLTYWPGSQAGGLMEINVQQFGNDRQFAAVQRHFGLNL